MPPELDDATRALLQRFHFDKIPFEALQEKLRSAASTDDLHRIAGAVAVPAAKDVHDAPIVGTEAHAEAHKRGLAMIERGQLAVVVLAGGMATRFGGVVKALAPLADDSTLRFIDVKTTDFERYGDAIDVTFMSSFATDAALRKALEGTRYHVAPQFISLRLNRDGSLFHDDKGAPSAYATGHGDLPDALAAAGAIDRWKAKGVDVVLVMNVDNLGATVDPALLDQHVALGGQITAELVSKRPGDKGGIAAEHDGAVKLCEAFRLPADFDHDRFTTFNTNTLWISTETLAKRERPWTWCVANKKVDGREAIQFERLVGELTWWSASRYVHVPRDGAQSRFLPVKDQDDLKKSREAIAAVLRERVGLSL